VMGTEAVRAFRHHSVAVPYTKLLDVTDI